MDLRSLSVGVGTGITAFLLVAVAVIEAVRVDPGAGILGVLLGGVAGVVAAAVTAARLDAAGATLETALLAVATFGYAVLVLLFLSYADVAGLRSVLDSTSTVLVGVVAGALVALGSWLRRGHRGPS